MQRFVRPRRLLIIANETNASLILLDEVGRLAATTDALEVMIVAPALPVSRLRHWCNDVQSSRDEAGARLALGLRDLRRRGIPADGRLGDADPMHAIEDALEEFAADEILVATLPPSRSLWLERRLVQLARTRFGLPVTHVVAREPTPAALGA